MKLDDYCEPNGRAALAAALNMGCTIHGSLGTKSVQQRIMVPLGALYLVPHCRTVAPRV
jgi:hypothetical protein